MQATDFLKDPSKIAAAASERMEDMLALSKDNAAAFVESGTILAKGMQEISSTVMGMTKAAIEDSMALGKSASSVKSVHDLVSLNQDFAKAALEKAIAEGSKLNELSISVAKDAAAPLTSRVEATVSTLSKGVKL